MRLTDEQVDNLKDKNETSLDERPLSRQECRNLIRTIEAHQQEIDRLRQRGNYQESRANKADYKIEKLKAEITELKVTLKQQNAAYEDSGLSPEEVQELARAKAEGRLVVLPCKVGDTVYWMNRFMMHVNSGVVGAIKISSFGFDLDIFESVGKVILKREFEKVFLTREAAEKALGGGQDGP